MKLTEEAKKTILEEARLNFDAAVEAEGDIRKLALSDLDFYNGNQWPANIKAMRDIDDKPCLVINKMPTFVDQVVGDQRMNRPAVKVIPTDKKGSKAIARILSGWIKGVESTSSGDIAIDHAFEHAVICGSGAFRVVTDYVDVYSNYQDAFIKKIDNALSVFWGKHTEYDCSDANYCFIVTDLSRKEYKDTYKKEPMPFDAKNSEYVTGWCDKDTVRVAEYFVKSFTEETLHVLKDGRTFVKLPVDETVEVVEKRKIKVPKITWYLIDGRDVLNSKEWAGKKYIPVIPVWGKEVNVGGKTYIRGLIRNAKDTQRMYNYWQSSDTEVIALQPKSPFLVTPEQISGHEAMWKTAHKKNHPYLLCNFDVKSPGWPKREPPPIVSSAMVQKIANIDQEMRDTIGLQKASLGMPSNERSGAAIRERKREGDVGTFAFIDNLARSVRHLGRVLLDIAPTILDTERTILMGLNDGSFELETVNVEVQENEKTVIKNNIKLGQYDVVVTVGPSFSTQRTEARQSMQEFMQYYPAAAPLIGDIYAEANDWSRSEEVAERLQYLLPPELKYKKEVEQALKDGKEPPQPPQPPPPSPDEVIKLEIEKMRLEIEKTRLMQEQERVRFAEIQSIMKFNMDRDSIKKMVQDVMQEVKPAGAVEPKLPEETKVKEPVMEQAPIDLNTQSNSQ